MTHFSSAEAEFECIKTEHATGAGGLLNPKAVTAK